VEADAEACWEDGGRVVLMPPLEVAAGAGADEEEAAGRAAEGDHVRQAV